ncbi:MAG: M14 family metallopeptidase [Clostridiaceae bacterium]
MIKDTIFSLKSPYRNDLNITGYRFGEGQKSACIVGAMRGNEVQQLYISSLLIHELTKLEAKGAIIKNHEILVIPSINHYAMNIGKRFWAMDNTDINRMFPGYNLGETTQRIAAGIFEKIKGYTYGIQLASFYIKGDFFPHVRMMETGYQDEQSAKNFGFKHVVLRKPKPYDTTTLNYNWQLWNTHAYSVYTRETDQIDEVSAKEALVAILRFLKRAGIIDYKCDGGYISTVIYEDDLLTIKTQAAGIFKVLKAPGNIVREGDVLARIFHPFEGGVISEIVAPSDGRIFFVHRAPLVMENEPVFKIVRWD